MRESTNQVILLLKQLDLSIEKQDLESIPDLVQTLKKEFVERNYDDSAKKCNEVNSFYKKNKHSASIAKELRKFIRQIKDLNQNLYEA
jgi:hypothetical protein